MLDRKYLRDVPLPEDLTNEQLFLAMEETQKFFVTIKNQAGVNLPSIIQSNNFSGVVSNVFTNKLDGVSPYKAYHDQKYPDLKHFPKGIGLEVKATNKPWKGGEGHNGHSGWHIIVVYKLDEDKNIEIIQLEIADLIGYEQLHSDWNYNGSKRNENQSQRTETYTTNAIGTAKLRDGTVYLNYNEIPVSSQMTKARQKLEIPVPEFSPFYLKRLI